MSQLEDLFAEHAKQDKEAQQQISERLTAIESTLKRYQGFVGGALFVVSAFWVFVATFGKELISWIRG